MSVSGHVCLVGAGPGAPDLITVRGLRYLRAADAILYDRLVDPGLLAEARPSAQKIFVGKASGRPQHSQRFINDLIVDCARAGLDVVRLKGGDPFVFGRGNEEAEALARAGVPFEIVPGLTSAVAVPTHAGIPLTRRGVARSFAVVAGHQAQDSSAGGLDLGAAAGADTVVVLMAVARLPDVVRALHQAGRAPHTPAALIEAGTTPDERIIMGTLSNICARAVEMRLRPPATFVLGDVVREALPVAHPAMKQRAAAGRASPVRSLFHHERVRR